MRQIESDKLTVLIAEHGAELHSIRMDGTEYLWNGDPKHWSQRAPNIFPYIARLTDGRYIYNGKSYNLDIHGFVKTSDFIVESASKDSISFCMSSDEQTKLLYPFDFLYRAVYSIEFNKLCVQYEVENRGGGDMFFGIGGHPGFMVPLEEGLAFDDYYLEFSYPCTPLRVTFSHDNFVTGRDAYPLEDDRIIKLRHSLFDSDAIILEQVATSVTLKSDRGRRAVTVDYPGMKYVGFWHAPKTEAPYVCIEPWSSLPSRKGVVEDLAKQPDLIKLPRGQVYRNGWCVTLD